MGTLTSEEAYAVAKNRCESEGKHDCSISCRYMSSGYRCEYWAKGDTATVVVTSFTKAEAEAKATASPGCRYNCEDLSCQ